MCDRRNMKQVKAITGEETAMLLCFYRMTKGRLPWQENIRAETKKWEAEQSGYVKEWFCQGE